jgi:DNA-directed RNA polymerase
MASKKAAAGVDNTQRRKWDKEEYAELAREREKAEEEEELERLQPRSTVALSSFNWSPPVRLHQMFVQ